MLVTPMPYTDKVMPVLTFKSGQRTTAPIPLAIAGRPEERVTVVSRVAAVGVKAAGGRFAGGVAWAAPVSVQVTHAVGPDDVFPLSKLVRWKWPGPLLAVARVGAVLTGAGEYMEAKAEGEQAMSDMDNGGTGTSAPDSDQSAVLAAHDRLIGRIEGMFDRLLATARAEACVGAAQAQGDRTVIPLVEVFAAGGFGGGVGSGQANAEADAGGSGSGGGGGGGGGGTSRSRPVARHRDWAGRRPCPLCGGLDGNCAGRRHRLGRHVAGAGPDA